MTTEKIWNPRFEHYARAHCRTPEMQLRHDAVRWPGGIMCGFQLWISARWSEWREMHGLKRDAILSNEDHVEFDRWLAEGVFRAD